VNDEAAIADESGRAFDRGDVGIVVAMFTSTSSCLRKRQASTLLGRKVRTAHRAMLAREITDLARCWLVRIAWCSLSRHVRIEVAVGGGAVAVGAYWEVVDVIDCALVNWRLISG
jgi:hypothetical protein